MFWAHFNSAGGRFEGVRWGPIDLAQCRQPEKSLVLLQLAIFFFSNNNVFIGITPVDWVFNCEGKEQNLRMCTKG